MGSFKKSQMYAEKISAFTFITSPETSVLCAAFLAFNLSISL